MLMFLEQNGGQSDNKRIAYKSFENVSHPKSIGTTLTNKHCAYQETKSSLLHKFTFVRKTVKVGEEKERVLPNYIQGILAIIRYRIFCLFTRYERI
jgi:hypothetical protein